MSVSAVTLNINGREALPVRAIPFVVEMSADLVAKELAGDEPPPWKRLDGLTAYHVQQGRPSAMQPFEWRRYVASLEELEAEIRGRFPKEESPNDPRGYGAWKRESVARLPAGVFVWRDEFEAAWEAIPEGRTVSRSLTFTPQLSDGERQLILEGFKGNDRPARGGEINLREGKIRLTELEQALEGDEEFADAAMASLREDDPLSTYTTATSGMALINHWLGERILNCYERGRVVDDTRAGTVFADENGDYSKAAFAIDHDRFVDVKELRLLCFKWDLPIPQRLRESETESPPVSDDDLPNEIGYTIRGAAIALAQKYSLPEDAIRKSIFEAAVQEKLTVRNPRTGLPYIPETRRDFYERVSIEDLNKWLEDSGVEYHLGCDAPQSEPKLRAQEKAILNKLEELQIDPQAVPVPQKGKAGVKKQVRRGLESNPLFDGITTFDKAWERLRGFGDIKDA